MWQDDIKIDLKEIDGKLWTGFIWFGGIVSSGRFCTMEMNLQFLLSGHMTLSAWFEGHNTADEDYSLMGYDAMSVGN